MRVAVFRAADDGRRTAARLAALGHEAVLAPVLRIVPTGATVPAGSTEALVFTSAHAPAALAAHPDGTASLRVLPCWCVGASTAAAARAAGFSRIGTGTGDAATLAEAIAADGSASRLTLVAGRDRKSDLERGLAQAGLALAVVEAYRAEAVPGWTSETVAGLAEVTAALHYSRRSAALACRLAMTADLGGPLHAWAHFCLSDDVASGLRDHGVATRAIAERPTETNLLALLGAA